MDTTLKGDHPRIISANQDGHQAKNRKKGGWNKKKSSPLKLLSQSQPNFAEMILGWSPFKIVSRDHRTQFWKGAIQGSFHKSLVAIGPVVSEEKIFMGISHRVLCWKKEGWN
jgi:hypothetical protein